MFLVSWSFATTLERGISPPVRNENPPLFEEVYRIRLENKIGGTIEVSEDEGQSWAPVGQVLYPTTKVSKHGYAAAKWVAPGRVSATAVNAIHIKTGALDKERTIFSLLPKEFLKPPGKYRSFLSPDSSIYTSIPAGQAIFGGGFSPFVGNLVMLSSNAQPVISLPQDYTPKVDDTLYILVDRPLEYPREIVFENRFGGRISLEYLSGEKKVVGEVLRPVSGVGRFEGSLYADPGRIRANHAGVIDVSVSPLNSLGGFQIVPALHGQDMEYVKKMTQWMVIGPVDVEDPSLEGVAPFFKFFIQPVYQPTDLESADWEEKLLGRFLVEVKYDGSEEWQPMPVFELERNFPLPGWANSALDKVGHFRILFPIDDNGGN
ncbi:MAG: hypothetical protein ABID35_00345 [Candidatus Margulisiibacteriota bacterium]